MFKIEHTNFFKELIYVKCNVYLTSGKQIRHDLRSEKFYSQVTDFVNFFMCLTEVVMASPLVLPRHFVVTHFCILNNIHQASFTYCITHVLYLKNFNRSNYKKCFRFLLSVQITCFIRLHCS